MTYRECHLWRVLQCDQVLIMFLRLYVFTVWCPHRRSVSPGGRSGNV